MVGEMPIREVSCVLVLKRSGKAHSKRWRKDNILDQEINATESTGALPDGATLYTY